MTRTEMIADGIELGCPAFMAFLADALGLEDTVKLTLFAVSGEGL